MTPTPERAREAQREDRDRFANVRVLVADRDLRTASLVHRVLFSFGFARIEVVTSGEQALQKLADDPFDLIITEWSMQPMDGIALVKAIRTAKDAKRLRRDIPIIMLTARGEKESVVAARDAGITEFLVKPFSAATISHRLIQVIDHPRAFVDAPTFKGPDRRRRRPEPGAQFTRRRTEDAGKARHQSVDIRPASYALRDQIGGDAVKLFSETLIKAAQHELLQAEGAFLDWAKDDIASLEAAYNDLLALPEDRQAHFRLVQAAYAIKSQAGIFGYDLGTQVAAMLVDYLTVHGSLDESKLTVVRKHIDTISVVFRQQIKEAGQAIGRELIGALHALTEKLG